MGRAGGRQPGRGEAVQTRRRATLPNLSLDFGPNTRFADLGHAGRTKLCAAWLPIDRYHTSGGGLRTTHVAATYLEVPLLFRHEAAERWHLYAGPYLAFLLNGTSQPEGEPSVVISPHINSGLMLGADYQLSKTLSLDFRYQRDLLQISTTPYNNSYHSYQLGVNWVIR